ncbi:MAG TPA: CapA family protein [Usitatibacter sp.]|nr:CapA family protein [Usitatibacter sp.]
MRVLFLAGDVMTGRGIDQVLPQPADARLYESYVKSARDYVALAERASGPIPAPVGFEYVWGDALQVLERMRPAVRIVNLETAITAGGEPRPDKGIHYRMHPANAGVLAAARLDCCAVANNHVLDWGVDGLADTLAALREARIAAAGAGEDAQHAAAPAAVRLPDGSRVLVFAYAHSSSGVPREWAATAKRPGVNFLPDLSPRTVDSIAAAIAPQRGPVDLVVASLHWGGNWGYAVDPAERRFAQSLIDDAGVDVVHGHSSHHPRGIEVHAGKPILYGCGDLVNDYEGIGGYEEFEPRVCAMYFPAFEAQSRRLARFDAVPLRIRRFRLERATAAESRRLAATLDRESRRLGSRVALAGDGMLHLEWKERVS